MEPIQAQIEKFVIDYFSQRSDVNVDASPSETEDRSIAWSIKLSEAATGKFGQGQNELSLIFDPELSLFHPEHHIVTSDHPLLEKIKNDINSSGQAWLSEAYLMPNLWTVFAKIEIPASAGSVNEAVSNNPKITYKPTVLMTYRLLYSSDIRQEYKVRLCYDAETRKPVRGFDYIDLRNASIAGTPLVGAKRDTQYTIPDLSALVEQGTNEVLSRVDIDSISLEAELSELLKKEEERLISGGAVTKDIAEKESNDLFRKNSCKIQIFLESAVLLWWPIIRFERLVSEQKVETTTRYIQYDTVRWGVFEQSSCCKKEFLYEELCSCCIDNRERICSECTYACADCGRTVCVGHSSTLTLHSDRKVCDECKQECSVCDSDGVYLHSDLSICVLCGKAICSEHSAMCSGCGRIVCEEHSSVLTFHDNKRVCDECRRACSVCEPNKVYLESDLIECTICGKPICSVHRSTCVDCGRYVCEEHSSALTLHSGRKVCDRCKQECDACGPDSDKVYLESDLAKCAQCGKVICGSHRTICQTCEKQTLCLSHVDDLSQCEGCGRRSCDIGSCGSTTHFCKACGMKYCKKCIGVDGLCTACHQMTENVEVSSDILALASESRKQFGESEKQIIEGLLNSPDLLKLSHGSNRTYEVLLLSYCPNWWQLRKRRFSKHKLRIVKRTINDEILKVKLEAAEDD